MICFHFSIFEPLETAHSVYTSSATLLWFAFILVSLNHWKQQAYQETLTDYVVICFHFSIFEPLETASVKHTFLTSELWFAFILVSLNHWKQHKPNHHEKNQVVICFHFSIFEPLETAFSTLIRYGARLWFAFILVSLNHWKQLIMYPTKINIGCDLLSF